MKRVIAGLSMLCVATLSGAADQVLLDRSWFESASPAEARARMKEMAERAWERIGRPVIDRHGDFLIVSSMQGTYLYKLDGSGSLFVPLFAERGEAAGAGHRCVDALSHYNMMAAVSQSACGLAKREASGLCANLEGALDGLMNDTRKFCSL